MVMVGQNGPCKDVTGRALGSFDQFRFEFSHPFRTRTNDRPMFVASCCNHVVSSTDFIMRWAMPWEPMSLPECQCFYALFGRHSSPRVHLTFGVHRTTLALLESRL